MYPVQVPRGFEHRVRKSSGSRLEVDLYARCDQCDDAFSKLCSRKNIPSQSKNIVNWLQKHSKCEKEYSDILGRLDFNRSLREQLEDVHLIPNKHMSMEWCNSDTKYDRRSKRSKVDSAELDAAKSLLSLNSEQHQYMQAPDYSKGLDVAVQTERDPFASSDRTEEISDEDRARIHDREQQLLGAIVTLTEEVATQQNTLGEQQLLMDKVLDEHESERVQHAKREQQLFKAVVSLTEKVATQQTILDEQNSALLQHARSFEDKTRLEEKLRHSLDARDKMIEDLRESDKKWTIGQEQLRAELRERTVSEHESREIIKKFENCLSVMKNAMSVL